MIGMAGCNKYSEEMEKKIDEWKSKIRTDKAEPLKEKKKL